MDAPAMAMMIIIMKHLLAEKITSKVRSLTGESIDLATLLGLALIAGVKE